MDRPVETTYENFENLDCYSNHLQDYLKYVKYGFGRVTDNACLDIRLSYINREEAVRLVSKYDGLLPKNAIIISKAYQQLKNLNANYCFSVTSFNFPIQRVIRISQSEKINMFYPEHLETRLQDLKESYHDEGQFYWGKAEAFKQQKPLFSKNAAPYILPRHLVQDIDASEDWRRAELMYQVLKKGRELD